MWYYNVMKNKIITKISTIFVFLLIAVSFFMVIQLPREEYISYAFESNQLENYDDYIDYIKANPTGLNIYIASVYDLLIQNIDEIKSEDGFSISLSTLKNFSEIKKLSSEEQLKVLAGAFNILKFDNPELFFIDFEKISVQQSLLNIIIKTNGSSCYIDGITSETDLDNKLNVLRNTRNEILSNIDQSWSDYEKICYVNDYIVKNVDYDEDLSSDIIHTVYGSLVNNYAVCDGYSYAVQYLLDGLGIPNLVCAGSSYNSIAGQYEGHMWSYVRIYNHWYGLDTTWNDPIGATDESNMRDYFLIGGNQTFGTGFYRGRTVSNYQISFSGDIFYELPVPTIESTKFINPDINEIKLTKSTTNGITTEVEIEIDATNVLEDMYFGYAFSNDYGANFGEIVKCEKSLIFNNSSQNGVYKFYILSDDGKVVDERLYLKDNGKEQLCEIDIGQTYKIEVVCQDTQLQWQILPNKSEFYEGEYVELSFTNIPVGYEIDSVESEQVSIQVEQGVYSFNVKQSDVQITVNLKEKEYNILVINQEGLEYQISKQKAKMGETVELVINKLPRGKELSNIEGVIFNGEIDDFVLNKTYSFEMPANDVEIDIQLVDKIYNIAINNNTGFELSNMVEYAIYGEEVTIEAINIPDNVKIVADLDETIEYHQNKNNIIKFIMPDSDIEINLSYVEIVKHTITILNYQNIEYSIDKEEGYFGDIVTIEILTIPDNYKIISIGNSNFQCEEVNENLYTFVMPDEDVELQFSIYQIPDVAIINENIETTLEFIEENGEYYYLLSITSLPTDKYVKNIYVYNDDIMLENVATKINESTYKIKLSDKDLRISFELADKAQLPGDNSGDDQYVLISILFILSVCFIAIIIYIFSNGWKKRDF